MGEFFDFAYVFNVHGFRRLLFELVFELFDSFVEFVDFVIVVDYSFIVNGFFNNVFYDFVDLDFGLFDLLDLNEVGLGLGVNQRLNRNGL